MSSKQFRQGEFLFREGDPVEGVLRVLDGRVEISRDHNGAHIVLGEVSSVQFLGEMGVIENRARRAATARAASDVAVELVGAAEFLNQVSREPDAARELIRRLSYRLHAAEDRIVADEQSDGPTFHRADDLGDSGPVPGLSLAAATDELHHQLSERLAISAPFVVGRAILPDEGLAPRRVDLILRDHEPLRLSRSHFAILQRHGRLFVRDLHSTLGTIVNGAPIGWHFGSDEAPLQAGDNEIIAGGVGSPFAFTLHAAVQALSQTAGGAESAEQRMPVT